MILREKKGPLPDGSDNKVPWYAGKNIFLVVFFLCNLILASYYIDTWNTPNSVSRILPVLTWQEENTLRINTYQQSTGDKSKVGDDYYSDKAPLPTFLMIPVSSVLHWSGIKKDSVSSLYNKHPVYIWKAVKINDGRIFQMDKLYFLLLWGGFLFGSLPFTLLVFLSLYYTFKRNPDWQVVLMVMLGWYGSYLFVYSGTFFSHILAGFLLLVSYLLINDKKYFFLGGVFSGLAFLSEYPVGLAFLVWPVLIYLNEKRPRAVLLFLAGVVPSLLAIFLYNYRITGSPFSMLNAYHAFEVFGNQLKQNYGFSPGNINWDAFWGLSFSSYMGIFFHIPLLFLVLFFLVRDLVRNKIRLAGLFRNYIVLFGVIYFLLFTSFFTWWGGWSYGPRYLVPLGCLLVFAGIRYLSGKKVHPVIYLLFTGFGLVCAWLAKSTLMYMIPDKAGPAGPMPDSGSNPVTQWLIPEFTAGRFNGNSLFTWIVSPQASTFLWILLFITLTLLLTWYATFISPQNTEKTVIKAKPKKVQRKS